MKLNKGTIQNNSGTFCLSKGGIVWANREFLKIWCLQFNPRNWKWLRVLISGTSYVRHYGPFVVIHIGREVR